MADVNAAVSQYLSVIKLQHVTSGVYIWEFVTSFDYELDFYTGKRRWRWTFWPYILCRYSLLGAVISLLLVLSAPGRLNCLAWAKVQVLLTFSSVFMASMLIALRVVAIWDRHPSVITLASVSMLALLGLLTHSVAISQGSWDDTAKSCVLPDSASTTLSVLSATLAVDVLLLLLMLYGLFRKRDARRFSLWNFLWKQNLLWLMLATATELPTVVVIALDFNEVLNQSLQAVGVLVLGFAATRMYRSLTDFLNVGRVNMSSDSSPGPKGIKLAMLQHSSSFRRPGRHPAIPGSTREGQIVEIQVQVERGIEGEGTSVVDYGGIRSGYGGPA